MENCNSDKWEYIQGFNYRYKISNKGKIFDTKNSNFINPIKYKGKILYKLKINGKYLYYKMPGLLKRGTVKRILKKKITKRAIANRSELYPYVCIKCGVNCNSVTITKGSIFIEIVLWLIFLLPGSIYSIWRFVNKYKGCPSCKSESLILVDSPLGKK
jgi:predicted Zn-ribbon and HTH transcriptional regulator